MQVFTKVLLPTFAVSALYWVLVTYIGLNLDFYREFIVNLNQPHRSGAVNVDYVGKWTHGFATFFLFLGSFATFQSKYAHADIKHTVVAWKVVGRTMLLNLILGLIFLTPVANMLMAAFG